MVIPAGHALINEVFLRVFEVARQAGRTGRTCCDGRRAGCLPQIDPRKSKVTELRFFGGFSAEEAVEVLKVSSQSVMCNWKTAKAWLRVELTH